MRPRTEDAVFETVEEGLVEKFEQTWGLGKSKNEGRVERGGRCPLRVEAGVGPGECVVFGQ